jgi:hypothetical protein
MEFPPFAENFKLKLLLRKKCTCLIEERKCVSFQANRLKPVITSTKYNELYILNENTTRIYVKRRRHTSSCNITRFYLLNLSKTKVNLNYIGKLISQLAGTTRSLGYKKPISWCWIRKQSSFSNIRAKHIHTCCMRNVWFLNIIPCGKYSKHWAFKGWFTCITFSIKFSCQTNRQ